MALDWWRVLLGVVLGSALPLCAQDITVPRTRTFSGLVSPPFPYIRAEEVGLSSEKLDWIGDEIVSWIGNGELVGSELLIVKDHKIVFHEAYGWSDRENRRPMERNSIFSIQSMSKPFTATAVLMLAEEGTISLDDLVARYIPGFAGDQRTTIHHLLSHTSGYADQASADGGEWIDQEESFPSLREWVEAWAADGPTEPFGEFSYSDLNYGVLGYIVEEASGMPIETFTEQRIIGRLGLENTRTDFSEEPEWRARLNPWYRWNMRARQYDLRWAASRRPWRFYAASGGLFSTSMDYAEFMELWLHKGEWKGTRLLSEEAVERALRSHARIDASFAYGYGWEIDQVESLGLRPFAHYGGDGTLAGAYPEAHAMVIFLTHSRWGPWVDGLPNRVDMSGVFEHRVGYGITGFMAWADEKEVMLSPDDRVQYPGSYLVSGSSEEAPQVLEIWDEAGLLQLRMGAPGSLSAERFHLVPLGNNRFGVGRYDDGRLEAVDPNVEIRFSTGTVEGGGALEVLKNDQPWFAAKRIEP